jgi:WD40 repeat protein
MGVVYRARQLALNRQVALKVVLAGSHATPAQLVRTLVEAEAVARLQHPNVVQIFEVGDHDGCPFLALEYVDGGNVARSFARTQQPPRRVAALVETLARAVHQVHRQGIVHRDLKPANILLTASGTPKIADFGLAKLLEGGGARTDSGTVLGTACYMAPEQVTGKTGRIGPAIDVYALGAILYQGLTGRPPFQGETPLETLAQVGSCEPIAPTRLSRRLSRDLEAVCLKCLEKDPLRRYASASDLADDLCRFQEFRPTFARPINVFGRWLRWTSRQPVLAAMLTALVLVTASGFAGVTWNWREAESARGDLELNLYLNRIALAERSLSLNNVGRAEQILSECPPALRQWEWQYLKRLCHSNCLALQANDWSIESLAFSPDGRHLATSGVDSFLRIWDLRTGRQVRELRGSTPYHHTLAYSPDGRRIATGGDDRTVIIWDAREGREIYRLTSLIVKVLSVAFSPDGGRLAIAGEGGDVTIWDTQDWKCTVTIPRPAKAITKCVCFSPDGRLLATAHWDTTIGLWDTATGREVLTLLGHTQAVFSVSFSPDGRRVASGSGDHDDCPSGEAKVWDLETGRELLTLHGHTGTVSEVAFSPDGRRLATSSWDKTVKLWDAISGVEVLTIRNQIDRLYCLAFSPDGSRLASVGNRGLVMVCDATPVRERIVDRPTLALEGSYSVAFSPDGRNLLSGGPGNSLRMWDVSSGELLATLQGHNAPLTDVAYAPDGRQIASASRDGTIRIWDTASRAETTTFRGHEHQANGLAFRPDGRRLVSAGTDHTIREWDLLNPREGSVFRIHDQGVYALAYRPDGRVIASVSEDRTLKTWEAATGNIRRVLWRNSDRITGVAFHPDGRRVAALCSLEGIAKVWEVETGRDLQTLRGVSGMNLAFSPDGARLACAGSSREVKLWNTMTWEEDSTLRGPTGEIRRLAFSHDSQRLASVSYEGKLLVWDLPEPARIRGTLSQLDIRSGVSP